MVKREITIDAPIERVFDILSDFKSYPKFLKTTQSAKERKRPEGLEVDFTVDVVKTIHYTLVFDLERPSSIRWVLVKGDLMKRNEGSWRLLELSKNKTKAVYSLDVDFGWLVPKSIVEMLTKTQLPEMLKAFKIRAETGVAA